MSLKLTFNPLKAALMLALIMFSVCTLSAEELQPSTNETIGSWLLNNLPFFALILSESLALLPTKASGIIQALLTLTTNLFKKK